MAGIYYTDADAGSGMPDVTDEDIFAMEDIDTLLDWSEEVDAACADMAGQLEAAALGGSADHVWVYRVTKAMGYQRRAQSRIKARLRELGWADAPTIMKIHELNRAVLTAKAREAVAVEFLRLCTEGAIGTDLFRKVEADALARVARRNAKQEQREAA